MNKIKKILSLVIAVASVISVFSLNTVAETAEKTQNVTANRCEYAIDVDGQADAVWSLATAVKFNTQANGTKTEATVKALISRKWVSGAEYADDTLYLLFEINKNGVAVTDNDTVFVGIDFLRCGTQTGRNTSFGVGLLSVSADGKSHCSYGWLNDYRKGDFVLKATKTAKDRWIAEMAIMLDGTSGSRDYTHNGISGFGAGTDIGFGAFVRDDSTSLPSGKSYTGAGFGCKDKDGILFPKSSIIVGSDISTTATMLSGDVNNDNRLTGKDATVILKALANWNVSYTAENRDADKNGIFNGKDAVYLLKYLANWNMEANSPYFNKTIFFLGDSICAASVDNGIGWAGRIGENNGFLCWKNYAANGASVSDCRSHTILTQLNTAVSDNCYKPDVVVLHGGVNDAWDSAAVGTVSDTPVSEYNPETASSDNFADAFEYLIYTAKRYYPKAKLLYIVNFKLNSNIGRLSDMSEYFNTAKAICEKWDVPYLDLHDNSALEDVFDIHDGKYASDGIHPSVYGYDVLTPFIESFVLSAFDEADAK